MRTIIRFICYFFLCTLAILTSCDNYEEGPAINLKSKTKRIAQEWKLIALNGIYDDRNELLFEFQKDGDFIQTNIRTDWQGTTSESKKGSWNWISVKDSLESTWKTGKDMVFIKVDSVETYYDIIRLSTNKLILEYSKGSFVEKYEFDKN